MSKGQTNRLTDQQKKAGGPKGIFGKDALKHEKSVIKATKAVFSLLVDAYPELEFRHRTYISKEEINKKLNLIDSRLGITTFVKNAKIRPDGGIIEVKDKNDEWRIILISEAKHQGKDVENIMAGKKVGKNDDQDLMTAGNAIERMHKNINEIRNFMLSEKHFPYVVFLQGSNFSTTTFDVTGPDGTSVTIKHDSGEMNRIDRVTSSNYAMKINSNLCKNIIININGENIMLQAASLYARSDDWPPMKC